MGTTSPAVNALNPMRYPGLPSSSFELHWYAAYTNANHEKRVAEQLVGRSVEHFLPLYQSVRRWKDRRVQLQLPLFPGYVFVRLALHDRFLVLQAPGVVKLVGFNGAPAALPEEEMDALRTSLASGVRAEPHPYLRAGRRVSVNSGPFQGMRGILVRKKNRVRVVISLDLIMRLVAVETDITELEPLG
jgi:transcription antitermination factor NusG